MKDLNNTEIYRIINEENNTIEEFRKANPHFKVDHSNIPETVEEIEHFEQLYSDMELGSHEYKPSDFNFKRTDAYTFQQLFSDNDNFEGFLEHTSMDIRPVVLEEVYKMISCRDPKKGHAIYECPDCHKSFCVPFTCKCRFCNTCAIKYQMDRALVISSKLIRCEHRHIVFTIPEQLRQYFYNDRNLLNLLFYSVQDCINFYINKRAPRKKLVPGAILVLHTFGRDLKWNPHIHCLVTEGASSNIKNCPKDDFWIKIDHFHYESLRKSFQFCLLKAMKEYLSNTLSADDFSDFKKLVNSIYNSCSNGFYVRAKPSHGSLNTVVKYMIRYFNRPVMAQSHILHFDGHYVVFYYQRHEDNMYVIEKVHIYDFIERLLIHIPDKHFKNLRYMGLYTSHKCVHYEKLIKLLPEHYIKAKKMTANWRMRIQATYHYDPLICPFCKSTMVFSELVIAKRAS